LLFAVNAGEVSDRALARIDLTKLRLAAEVQKNIIPRAIGYGTFRPGTKYITGTASNSEPQLIPFVFNTETKALIELTPSLMRVLVDDVPITRVSVTTAITNGTFTSDVASWTDTDDAGGTSEWVTGGYLGLTGNGFSFAIRKQEVTVAAGDQNDEHALRIIIERGPVILRVGSTEGGDEYINETTLQTGTHSLAFTPTGNFWIQFQSNLRRQVRVDSVAVESSGVMTLPTPWGADEIGDIHYVQSGDVIFCAQDLARQRRIERRAARSWSVVEYLANKGPFRSPADNRVKITPSARTGNITLTASKPLFRSSHVGALFRLTQAEQLSAHTFTAADQYTDTIRVTGAGSDDHFFFEFSSLTGTGTTVTLQMSRDEPGDWIDINTYTSNQTVTFGPSSDYANLIRFYRLIVKSGDYSTGSPLGTIWTGNGVSVGIVRITAFSSSTSVSAEVLESLGSIEATFDWDEGAWSDFRGWPETVTLHDGRLWWGGKDFVYGSVSDEFSNFDDTTEGDSGPIVRSLSLGPIEGVIWLLSMQRLLGGTASQIVSMRASSLDEPMTPTNFGVREISNRGTSHLQAIKVDTTGIYVQRNRTRVREIVFGVENNDYVTDDLTKFKPEMCDAGIVSTAIQNQPDTRIWCVLDDGSVAMCCYDRAEEMVCWIDVDFGDGLAVAVTVLPGEEEDDVYLAINRTINGSDVCYIEKMALESECVGGSLNKNMDSHYVYSGASTATITGLDHLEGESVVVWGNSKALHDQTDMETVTSGSITISESVTSAVVGLPYDGRFKPAKLAYGAQLGTAIGQKKKISHLLILLADTVHKGITYGRHFDDDSDAPANYVMNSLPRVYKGAVVSEDNLYDTFEAEPYSFDGTWDTDARFCVKAMSPYPAHILGFVAVMDTNEK
jgi:hypothetical protein